jgi:hypothetical protein
LCPGGLSFSPRGPFYSLNANQVLLLLAAAARGGEGMREVRRRGVGALFGTGMLLGLLPSQASAVEKDLTDKGEVLVRENCGRCRR